jgi:endonuclease-3
MLIPSEIKKILLLLNKQYHQRTTALNYKTPFELLVATILSAQTTDKQVNKVTKDIFQTHRDPFAFSSLSRRELENKLKSLGLYKTKAKNILATCNILVSKYRGEVPTSREELMQLPGVGRKTANVFLSIATGFAAIAVDTHVFRVANRIGIAQAKDVLTTEKQLMQNIPEKKWNQAHHWLIWHGREICKARRPLCEVCKIKKYCLYYKHVT